MRKTDDFPYSEGCVPKQVKIRLSGLQEANARLFVVPMFT